MRYAKTAITATFKSTLEFFANRDSLMGELLDEFPDWIRGTAGFNLIDTKARRVIRLEAQRLIVRCEGHESLESFQGTLKICRQMLERFAIRDFVSSNWI